MSKTSLSDGTGPGSSISLAPETIRIRNALIEKFIGEPLDDMNNFMTMALSNEKDELRRLGILAARIYILRHRVSNLKDFNRDPSLTSMKSLDTTALGLSLPSSMEESNDHNASETQDHGWSRIQMIEPGEVNGVRFLAGTIIDTQEADADKLIKSGKAVRIDEDGNTIEEIDKDSSDGLQSVQPNNDDASTDSIKTAADTESNSEETNDPEAETNANNSVEATIVDADAVNTMPDKIDGPQSTQPNNDDASTDSIKTAADTESNLEETNDPALETNADNSTEATIVDADAVDTMLNSIEDSIEKEDAKS